jgi:hypothetical protein
MDELGTPNDRYFRESFGRLEIAPDFLLQNLPATLLAEIDCTTLEIAKDTDVDEDLSEDCSDIVYRIACHGGELQVHLLFERKRRPDTGSCSIRGHFPGGVPQTAPEGAPNVAGLPAGALSQKPQVAGAGQEERSPMLRTGGAAFE